MLLGVILLWLAMLVGSMFSFPYTSFILPDATWSSYLGFGNLFFIISIPVVIVLLYFWRYTTQNTIPNWAKTSLSLFWLGNLISISMLGGYVGRQFMAGNSITETQTLYIESDTLKLGLSGSLLGNEKYLSIEGNDSELNLYGKDLVSSNVKLDILPSTTKQFELERHYTSRGSDLRDSEIHADQIEYNFSFARNTLYMSPDFLIREGKKWRNQKVHFVLKVPRGKNVYLPDGISKVLNSIDADWDRKKRRFQYGGNTWKMEDNGLICPECEEKIEKKKKSSKSENLS